MERVEYSEQPERILYLPQADGSAEVWLRNNIRLVNRTDGELSWNIWVAEEVMFVTHLTLEEVTAQFDEYFVVPEPQPTIEDLVEAMNILEDILLGGAL